jgi:Holliday junction resolvasome RuvABC endonuclease subunit
MFDNLLFRTESGLSFLGLNSKYKNDLQLQEEMWAGGLLSLLSPQSAAVSAKNFYETYKGVERAYGMGKFIEESLSKNADINGIETFFRNMRKYDFVNSSDYEQTLNYLRDELKSAKTSKDGKTTRRWKIDTDALYKIIGPVNRNLKDANGDPIKP